jgi:uncharacterized protein GlcG (DUF336 family)
MTISQLSVSLEDAQRVIAAGQAKAGEIGSPSNVAVVDAGGNLVSNFRMKPRLGGQRRHLDQQSVHGARL